MSAHRDLVIVKNIHESNTRGQKGIYNRLHIVYVAFFVHVAGVTLAECADCWAVPLEKHRPNVNYCSTVAKHIVRLEGIQNLRIYTFG